MKPLKLTIEVAVLIFTTAAGATNSIHGHNKQGFSPRHDLYYCGSGYPIEMPYDLGGLIKMRIQFAPVI